MRVSFVLSRGFRLPGGGEELAQHALSARNRTYLGTLIAVGYLDGSDGTDIKPTNDVLRCLYADGIPTQGGVSLP